MCEGYLCWIWGLGREIRISLDVSNDTVRLKWGVYTLYIVTLWGDFVCAGGGGCMRRVGGAET